VGHPDRTAEQVMGAIAADAFGVVTRQELLGAGVSEP
jgi:hypothetical protein